MSAPPRAFKHEVLASRILTVAGSCYGTLEVLHQHGSVLALVLTAGLYGMAGAGLVKLAVLSVLAWRSFRS